MTDKQLDKPRFSYRDMAKIIAFVMKGTSVLVLTPLKEAYEAALADVENGAIEKSLKFINKELKND